MKTLIYWKARFKSEDKSKDIYSIRAKTRKECVEQVNACGSCDYETPRRVYVKYRSIFDMFHVAAVGIYEEYDVKTNECVFFGG